MSLQKNFVQRHILDIFHILQTFDKEQLSFLIHSNEDVKLNEATKEFEIEFGKLTLDQAANLMRDINQAIELKTELEEKLQKVDEAENLTPDMRRDFSERFWTDYRQKCLL